MLLYWKVCEGVQYYIWSDKIGHRFYGYGGCEETLGKYLKDTKGSFSTSRVDLGDDGDMSVCVPTALLQNDPR